MFDESRAFLRSLGLPGADAGELPDSQHRFPDGSHYGIEVPTVNSLEALRALFAEAERLQLTINRVDETLGGFRHSMAELREYVAIARDRGAALNVSIGPRAAYDISPTRLSPQGAAIAYRLRGSEQLVRALEDAKRSCEAGVRGLLVYDEGLLWVLHRARQSGQLPQDVTFKVSAHMGHGNGASFHLLEELGADSINPVRDLTLPMLCSLRASVTVPLDVHTDNPASSGGFVRSYEAPEMVRCCAPVYLKTGNSALGGHGMVTGAQDAVHMARQAAVITEMLARYYPQARQLPAGTQRGGEGA